MRWYLCRLLGWHSWQMRTLESRAHGEAQYRWCSECSKTQKLTTVRRTEPITTDFIGYDSEEWIDV